MSKQRYFHATSLKNITQIQIEGLKPIWDYVYLTDSLESAQRWMGFRFKAQGEAGFAVVEVEMDPKELGEGTDHSPLMQQLFGAGKSLISEKRIPKTRIKKVHYFEFAE